MVQIYEDYVYYATNFIALKVKDKFVPVF